MGVIRAPAVVFGPREARVLRAFGLRGLLEAQARQDGRRLSDEMVALLRDVDEVALASVETVASDRSVIVRSVTVATASQALGVSPQRVTSLLRDGRLFGRKRRGAWAIDSASLVEVAASLGRPLNGQEDASV